MHLYHQWSDQDLIARFSLGHDDALEALLLRHKEKLFTSILLLVRDPYLAEDIFQETFIKVIDTIRQGRYTEKGKFLSWAMRIAHNLCVDHFRKVKRNPTIRTSDNEDLFSVLPFSAPCAEEVLMTRQSHERVRLMLDLLPAEQKEVIVLRHFGELSFKEIAELTQVSINTALGRMRYGLINLRKMMAEKQICL